MKTSMTCLHVLILPNWKLKFHVHINASKFAIGAMLNQNLDKTIDEPIFYTIRLMNSAKKTIQPL
jgi:hypothetical protein